MTSTKMNILVRIVEWVDDNRVRVFFSTGRVVELALPVESAKYARVVDEGLGVDPGDGRDVSAYSLYFRRGKELRPDRYRKRLVPFWQKKPKGARRSTSGNQRSVHRRTT